VLSLDLPEAQLSKAREDFTHGNSFGLLDFSVEIHEGAMKLEREFTTNRALSRSHESDQIDAMHRYDYTMVPMGSKALLMVNG
jgi:hypothetical protein